MAELELKQEDLLEVLGVTTRGAVGHYLSGRRNLSAQQLASLSRFLGLSLEPYFTEPSSESSETHAEFVTVQRSPLAVSEPRAETYLSGARGSGEVTIPFYPNIKAAAGAGYSNHEADQREPLGLKFRAESLKRQGIDPSKCYVITARGDSMEPLIYTGDSILFDASRTAIKDGCLYVVDIDHDTVVKRLFKRPGGKVLVSSENPQHPAFEAIPDTDGFKVIGEVRWRAGWV